MSGTMGTLRSPDRRPCRDLASDSPPINPVIPAAGGSCTVTVDLVDYVARWAGYDTEKCIKEALEDGVIELDCKSDWSRDHDVYRLTPKGRRQSDDHIQDVFERSARVARQDCEDMRKRAQAGQAAGAAAAGPGRPPPLAAGELIPTIGQFKGAAAGGTAQRPGCGAPLGPAACNRARPHPGRRTLRPLLVFLAADPASEHGI